MFVNPREDLTNATDPTKYNALINLDRETLRQRWTSDKGKEIFHTLRGNFFNREVLKSHVGTINGKFDLRGIPIKEMSFMGTDFTNCDFFYADLQGTNFTQCNFSDSYLSECDIRGSKFDWGKLENVLIDNVEFDNQTSFKGVDLGKINFTLAALLREAALNQQFIHDLETKHKQLATILRVTSDYGRSFTKFGLWCIGIVIFFAFLFFLIPGTTSLPYFASLSFPKAIATLIENIYFSIITFTTLGFLTITPVSWIGKLLVVLEVAIGYFMMGLLIAILTKKIVR